MRKKLIIVAVVVLLVLIGIRNNRKAKQAATQPARPGLATVVAVNTEPTAAPAAPAPLQVLPASTARTCSIHDDACNRAGVNRARTCGGIAKWKLCSGEYVITLKSRLP